MKHFLTGEELSADELKNLLYQAEKLKKERQDLILREDLKGQNLTLFFEKPSLRTRMSFTVAMQELGGHLVEVQGDQRKKEEPEDTIQVLAGYTHALMCRTHDHKALERMAKVSQIPIINGLSESHHPCQALADALTLQENFKSFNQIKLTYVGDGNNVLHSLLLVLPYLGVHLHYACPPSYQPNALIVKKAKVRAQKGGGSITAHTHPSKAASESVALYTDVWTSMGYETQEAQREKVFAPFQLNEELYQRAHKEALIMHCMPMLRGKEISETMADHKNSMIFKQSENRLHVQKALLLHLLGRNR